MERTLSRRKFLLGSTAILLPALLISGSFADAQQQPKFEDPVAMPPLDAGLVVGGVRVFELELQNGTTEFFSGLQTRTSGINGSYLGPMLRMRTGEKIRLNVSNALNEISTLHWHGMNLPAKADGGPHQPIEPGSTWAPEFEVRDAASTMWFHSHHLHRTAAQVWAGLAGLIMIEDDLSDRLDLPSRYGIDDVPLVLQDRRFNRDGSMPYNVSMHDEMAGMLGDFPLINGTIRPYFQVTTEKLRIRLLNGANASIYNLEFEDGRSFVQIASDGGFLDAPVLMRKLKLAPGERAEIIVDFAPDESVILRSVASNGRSGMGMMMGAQNPQFDMIEFRAGGALEASATTPQNLANLPAVSTTDATRTRKFVLEMPGMGPMRMLGLGGGFTINGRAMEMSRIDETVKMGEPKIWEIQNNGPMIHPFHIHNTQFRILDRNGKPPASNEKGLKDTVVVDPGETVRILVKFEHYSDAERPYMYHCHILEHEDAGMMGQFTVS